MRTRCRPTTGRRQGHCLLRRDGAGGWNAPRNFITRVIEYVTVEGGKSWERTVISQARAPTKRD